MKAVGCAAVAIIVMIGGFLALATFVIGRTDDQSALTQKVDLTLSDVVRSRSSTTGAEFRFDLAYEVDGRWFGSSDAIDEDFWDPSRSLTACVDPDDPRQFVVTLRDERCGQESIVAGTISEAEPTSKPEEAGQPASS